MIACPCGGIGRRVGLKIRSGLNLGASSSLAKGNLKRTHESESFFVVHFYSVKFNLAFISSINFSGLTILPTYSPESLFLHSFDVSRAISQNF